MSRPARLKRTALLVALGVAAVGVAVLFVLPGRTWLEQRSALAHTTHQLQVLDAENAKLRSAAASLATDGEIERIARERYGLVMPGQEEYVVLPPAPGVPAGEVGPTTTTTAPSSASGSSHASGTGARTTTSTSRTSPSASRTTTTVTHRSTTTTITAPGAHG